MSTWRCEVGRMIYICVWSSQEGSVLDILVDNKNEERKQDWKILQLLKKREFTV